MTPNALPWISRQIADEIYEQVMLAEGAHVYFIEAPAGAGKTFVARDIGTRLGSHSGYESSCVGPVCLSGILDVYDPDTNSNQGIERRLIAAFKTGGEFDSYDDARGMYDAQFKGGIAGSSLEQQRRKIELAFAQGLQEVSRERYPVIMLDTVERLESAADPTQLVFGFLDDTTLVTGWLLFQISQLHRGMILLFGRRADRLYHSLENTVQQANRNRPGLVPIQLHHVNLGYLTAQELDKFYADRVLRYSNLARTLTDDLKQALSIATENNPLLLDLALLTLLESADPSAVKRSLQGRAGMAVLEQRLLQGYMNSIKNPDRHLLLQHLALARNGLFEDLLCALEPNKSDHLLPELRRMENLPYIKVREIALETASAGSVTEDVPKRRTYFLHDAMYTICDRSLFKPDEVAQESKVIAEWYDRQIAHERATTHTLARASHRILNLLVESLWYRMRMNPRRGYHWYIREADLAIRNAQTGLDMRLRDAMALYLASATESQGDASQSLTSPIDSASVKKSMPELFDLFNLDSATLWIKRATVRGKGELAEQIGVKFVEKARQYYLSEPDRYALPLADYLLWYGQAVMYGYDISHAQELYAETLRIIEQAQLKAQHEGKSSATDVDEFDLWRLHLIRGRTYNNMGYTHWMYLGQYHRAIHEFQQALRFFRAADLEEEIANSSDNMGRVYALLGSEFQAVQLINTGLEKRRKLGLSYREALSANSLAQAYIRFGQFEAALRTVDNALIQFHRAEQNRGIGLGLMTRGLAYRSLAESWRETDIPLSEALRYTNLSETDLREAVRLFTNEVHEPIRTAEAYNELACCYRARYWLLANMKAPDADQETALAQARQYFRRAVDSARHTSYTIDELDSQQDLAVLLTRRELYSDAERYLEDIRNRIPESHKIQMGQGFPKLDSEEQIDAYYKLMGQVELLTGTIEFESGLRRTRQTDPASTMPERESILKTARRYLLAVSYFNHFSDEQYARRHTYARIYKRFQDCDPDLVREIAQKHLPQWIKEYRLPDRLVRSLLSDVFGLLD